MEYPVTAGQLLTLDCQRTGEPGEAVAQWQGLTVFVEKALPGERVTARVTECAPRYARARVEQLLLPSPQRAEPSCPLYGRCGGCCLQHMSAQAQAQAKTDKVVQALQRLGGFAPGSYRLDPILSMVDPLHYRNKAVYACGLHEGQVRLGLYEPGSHHLAATTACLLQPEAANRAAGIVEAWMRRHGLPAYDPGAHRGLLRHLVARTNQRGELLLVLVVNGTSLPHAQDLVQALRAELPNLVGLVLNQNTRRNAPILQGPCQTLYGRDTLEETMLGLTFRISPLSFFQINPAQTARLYQTALDFARLRPSETAVDAYCGSGTIALLMAKQSGAQVVGVELYAGAVADARDSALRNGLPNASFYQGSCETVLPRLVAEGLRFDVATVDPPRKGCDRALLRALLQAAPQRIIYVSCNPATLARDMAFLHEGGYAPERVQPVDMFPLTGHVETVVLLSKLNTKQHIEVELNLDELDLTAAESKATYDEIKTYVLEKHGLKVSSLYISQVKRKCGLDVGQNYNLSKKEDAKVPQCPPEKEAAIVDALKYFQMI